MTKLSGDYILDEYYRLYKNGDYTPRPSSKSPEDWLYFDIFFDFCSKEMSLNNLIELRDRLIADHPNHYAEIENAFIFALKEYSGEMYDKQFLFADKP